MILILGGITAWLAVSVAVGLVLARTLALKEGDDSLEQDTERGAQLQLVTASDAKREHAA